MGLENGVETTDETELWHRGGGAGRGAKVPFLNLDISCVHIENILCFLLFNIP